MKVFYIQQGLKNASGHWLLETSAWRDAVRASQLEWRGYGHTTLAPELGQTVDMVPLFPFEPHAQIDTDPISRDITDLLYLSEQFAAAAQLMEKPDASDLVVIEFTTAREIYGVARWMRNIKAAKRPHVAFIIHWPDWAWALSADRTQFSGNVSVWRFAMNQLRANLPGNKIYVGAVDPRLAEFLCTILDLRVDVTPLIWNLDTSRLPAVPEIRYDLLFSGGSRPEKGTHLIGDVLAKLRQSQRALRIALQVEREEERAQLLLQFPDDAQGSFKLDIAVGALDSAAYVDRFVASRLCVLPYVAASYGMRASAIAGEAFGYGIPIVAPANTWMSDRLTEGSGAGVLFDRLDADTITEAITTALDHLTGLTETARFKAPAWRANYSATAALARVRAALSL